MNNLLTRTISGIVLVLIVIGSVLLSKYSMLLLILSIYSISVFEFRTMFKLKEKGLFFFVLLSGQLIILINFLILNNYIIQKMLPISFILLLTTMVLYYLFSSISTKEIGRMFFGLTWIATTLSFYIALGWIENQNTFNPQLMLILLILIWVNDIGAYFFGSLFGKNPMAPAISPGKTWEGFISGILLNVVAGFVIFKILHSYSPLFWIIMGVVSSLGATAGDLFESKLKREAGVKDSGQLIPGHGGVLDRFDSLLFTAPLFYLIILIWDKL